MRIGRTVDAGRWTADDGQFAVDVDIRMLYTGGEQAIRQIGGDQLGKGETDAETAVGVRLRRGIH